MLTKGQLIAHDTQKNEKKKQKNGQLRRNAPGDNQ